jgi:hypothetical protein
MWQTFSGADEQALTAVADHLVSTTQVSGVLIGAGFAVVIPAVAALARLLDIHAARLAVPLFAVGAGLTLADLTFGLKSLMTWPPGHPWCRCRRGTGPMHDWGGALFTTGTRVLGAVALLACGCEVLRRRALARWFGWVAVAAAVAMLAQLAAFGGLLPFPQFLAFLALGAAVLARSRRGQGAGQDRGVLRGNRRNHQTVEPGVCPPSSSNVLPGGARPSSSSTAMLQVKGCDAVFGTRTFRWR